MSAFIELLVAFQQNRLPICPSFQIGDLKKYKILKCVFQNNFQLGQEAFHVGYVSYKWSMVQSMYSSKINQGAIYDVVSWSAQVIQLLWDFSTHIWTRRCSMIHSKNPANATSLNVEELKASIKKYLGFRRDKLSPSEKSLHIKISS